jgi:hypothetical protein
MTMSVEEIQRVITEYADDQSIDADVRLIGLEEIENHVNEAHTELDESEGDEDSDDDEDRKSEGSRDDEESEG